MMTPMLWVVVTSALIPRKRGGGAEPQKEVASTGFCAFAGFRVFAVSTPTLPTTMLWTADRGLWTIRG